VKTWADDKIRARQHRHPGGFGVQDGPRADSDLIVAERVCEFAEHLLDTRGVGGEFDGSDTTLEKGVSDSDQRVRISTAKHGDNAAVDQLPVYVCFGLHTESFRAGVLKSVGAASRDC